MFIVTSANEQMPVKYSAIFGKFASAMPQVARYVVFHNYEKHAEPDTTLDALYRRASRLWTDFRRDRWFEEFENATIRAIESGEAQVRLHRNVMCVVPEPMQSDKLVRLRDFFGMSVDSLEAQHLWPAFLDFSTRMLLGQTVYLHRRRESGAAFNFEALDSAIGISDAFAVLWQIKEHGDRIVPFSEKSARGRINKNDTHYRTEEALRQAYRYGVSADGAAWLKGADLSEIHAKAEQIWNACAPFNARDRDISAQARPYLATSNERAVSSERRANMRLPARPALRR